MDKHGQTWTNTHKHGQTRTSMDKHAQAWTNTHKHGQTRISMDKHSQAWANTQKHGRTRTKKRKQGHIQLMVDKLQKIYKTKLHTIYFH